jgi:hypothetical protein
MIAAEGKAQMAQMEGAMLCIVTDEQRSHRPRGRRALARNLGTEPLAGC